MCKCIFFSYAFAAVPCPPLSTGVNLASGCTCSLSCVGTINATVLAPNFYGGACYCPETEFKALGAFNWTAPFTGTLSVMVVAGGGGGGLL